MALAPDTQIKLVLLALALAIAALARLLGRGAIRSGLEKLLNLVRTALNT